MIKIIYPICLKFDAQINFVDATIRATNKSGVTDYQTNNFQLLG